MPPLFIFSFITLNFYPMAILSYADLNTSLLAVQSPVPNYDTLLFDFFTNMYNTGCRPMELFDVARWSFPDATHLNLFPLKGNNQRLLIFTQLSPYFRNCVMNDYPLYYPLSYRRMRYHFCSWYTYYKPTIGNKDVELYLFRHRYVKGLKLAGMPDLDIQNAMGWTNLSMVNRYVNSVITV